MKKVLSIFIIILNSFAFASSATIEIFNKTHFSIPMRFEHDYTGACLCRQYTMPALSQQLTANTQEAYAEELQATSLTSIEMHIPNAVTHKEQILFESGKRYSVEVSEISNKGVAGFAVAIFVMSVTGEKLLLREHSYFGDTLGS